MRIAYLTPLRYPSKYTNRLQVLKMSEAFSKHADFTLFVERLFLPQDALFREHEVRYTFSIKSIGSPFFYPRSFWLAWRYRHIIECEPADTVFYIRDVLLAFFLAVLSKRFRGSFFFENHSLGKFPDFIYQKVFSAARGTITTNARKKEDIIKKFSISAEHILVFGNGIDLEVFSHLKERDAARANLRLEVGKPIVVYTGTIAEAYGAGVIDRVRELLRDEARVHAVSGLPGKVALDYIAAADIVLAPYLTSSDHFRYYMSPMKIKEYMAAGRVIVASDLPAIREILTDDAAYFALPGDAEAFAAAIRRAIAYPDEAAAKARHARELAESFDWEKRAAAIVDFMDARMNLSVSARGGKKA